MFIMLLLALFLPSWVQDILFGPAESLNYTPTPRPTPPGS